MSEINVKEKIETPPVDGEVTSEETTSGQATPDTTTEEESDTKTDKDDKVKYEPQGSICKVHNVYQTMPDDAGQTSWTKDLPESLIAPAEDADSAQYALIIRNAKCYDGRKSLKIHSVVVQSEPLKKFLGKALEGYPGVTTTLQRLDFTAPFKPLVHRWDELIKARDEEEDATTKEHVDLFYNIFEEELRDVLASKKDMTSNGVITHELLWTILEPDGLIINTSYGRTRAFLFDDASIDCRTKSWIISANYIEYDGVSFGFDDETFKVPYFIGTKPITSLPISPLKYHANKDTIRNTLLAQGKAWEEHKGFHYKQYEGLAFGFFYRDGCEDVVRYQVKSRIIIDAEAFGIFHTEKSIYVNNENVDDVLTDEQRIVASGMVYGYSLKDKEWLKFYLDSTSDIEWNTRAFDSLVLPKGQENLKELILAFAQAQSKQVDDFDDVVQGKGRGIIMQLSGPPGVGKTLTAESVAEVMKVPLYSISAGDLGTANYEVEKKLKDILRMTPRWGAVLLIDEADVFMEARSPDDLVRNELVSIFLRLLEYYEGILFLTTNRSEHIDPAFESRIHVSIAYSDLDVKSRRHVWSQFLNGSTKADVVSEEELDNLSAVELNGRQIKNVIKTASLLAWSKNTYLQYEHIQKVLSLRELK
ncbi:hypothetical protein N7495_004443 [Penicillium taxi]|uniref:uncharacterized protein n=1 Tax=Penicillium taxi TaxID=168475 RepID=UPI002545AD64|nr:uncharacterized protein N7495_004443 [Penicillium taxi]KAJ5899699.1 hypothetical protein N7495_004443 [Penicillium taxi]